MPLASVNWRGCVSLAAGDGWSAVAGVGGVDVGACAWTGKANPAASAIVATAIVMLALRVQRKAAKRRGMGCFIEWVGL